MNYITLHIDHNEYYQSSSASVVFISKEEPNNDIYVTLSDKELNDIRSRNIDATVIFLYETDTSKAPIGAKLVIHNDEQEEIDQSSDDVYDLGGLIECYDDEMKNPLDYPCPRICNNCGDIYTSIHMCIECRICGDFFCEYCKIMDCIDNKLHTAPEILCKVCDCKIDNSVASYCMKCYRTVSYPITYYCCSSCYDAFCLECATNTENCPYWCTSCIDIYTVSNSYK